MALIAAAGLVLHRIARRRLERDLAAMVTLAFFGANASLARIPHGASVVASNQLIPHLAARLVLVRFPDHGAYQTRSGAAIHVEWVAVDLNQHLRYAEAFRQEQKALKRSLQLLKTLPSEGYRVQAVNDGVVVLQRNGEVDASAEQQLNRLLREIKEG
ncbi:DUF2079 domain-containing protein [Vulcanococcus sp. Clear-D1]|uniref:DUF2079 domain-containing protein n=1 Tax=Vulcanococcus sp. Clear-D1 TaxID=2766970 RepID=UPI0025D1242A|nr:DUF2079 domain-containing protein [Vulcanococcus sp. Clear-D1]